MLVRRAFILLYYAAQINLINSQSPSCYKFYLNFYYKGIVLSNSISVKAIRNKTTQNYIIIIYEILIL
jgi:hypothetical protein